MDFCSDGDKSKMNLHRVSTLSNISFCKSKRVFSVKVSPMYYLCSVVGRPTTLSRLKYLQNYQMMIHGVQMMIPTYLVIPDFFSTATRKVYIFVF